MTRREMPIRALAPWYGAGRLIADRVGLELEGCDWVGIPFAGGMSEVATIDARGLAVNDLHRHVINLARVVADPLKLRELATALARLAFHPDELAEAQAICRAVEAAGVDCCPVSDVVWARAYFVACWMARNGRAGTETEFSGGIATRWIANGGCSAVRYRSAVRSLAMWHRSMRRCTFTAIDAFEFLEQVHDTPKTGLYIDAPWPDDGARYRHAFSVADQRRLAKRLSMFKETRVVVRFGDHPLIRELYSWNGTSVWWQWIDLEGRNQKNAVKHEVLLINGASRAKGRLFV